MTGGRFLAKCLDLISLLILARFLGPAEFGVVAMAMTAVIIVETFSEMPLSAALLNYQAPTDAMYDTALTIAILRALAIVATLCALSWPLAQLYDEPRLIALQCALSLAPAMRGLLSQRLTEYARVLDFRRDVALDVMAKAGSLVIATILAAMTGSYWAIAIGKISTTAIAMIASYLFAPQRFRLTLAEWHVFADMIGWNAARQILVALNWQIDKLILPRFVDVATFGRFSWADSLVAVPAQAIIQPITPPLFSAFVAAREGGQMDRVYLKASTGVFAVTGTIFLMMALLAEPIIHLILGPRWQETAPILTWLACAAAIGFAPTVLLPALAMALNNTRIAFIQLLIEFSVKVPLIIALTMTMKLQGLLIGHTIASVVGFIVTMVLVHKLADLSITTQLIGFLRPSAAMLPMALFLLGTSNVFGPQDSALYTFLNLSWICGVALVLFAAVDLFLWKLSGAPDGWEALALRMARKIVRR
ncbi:oligosaccharide flippase family protein [Rhizobium sp. CRIBSB]|nr:oligosaccharide flippase family protein [Rhizobium sp. CRIBSB]